MMRVRIPGGQLNYEQAQAIGKIAQKYGNDYIDITTRMQIELRYLSIENIPNLLKELDQVGLTSFQTGVDNFRNVLCDPLDGRAFDSPINTIDIINEMQKIYMNKDEWISALPRKFNTAINGSYSNRCNVFGQDCNFVLAKKDGILGFNVYLGGKVGVIATKADFFLEDKEEVVEFFYTLIKLFKEFGFRDNRNKNRLHFLIETIGMVNLEKALREKAKINFAKSGETLSVMDNTINSDGRVQLSDGTFALNVVVPSGVFSGSALLDASLASKLYGDGEIRLTYDQNLFILGVGRKKIDAILDETIFKKYKNISTPYFNDIIACAGTEHCPFGVIPNKPDAIEMANYLSKEVPLKKDAQIRMYWSACVKGCGVHGLGDIGFIGCKAKVDGVTEYGVDILIGGKLGAGRSHEARTILKAVPLRFAKYYILPLMQTYKDLRQDKERFEHFETRVLSQYSNGALAFFMSIRANFKELTLNLKEKPTTLKVEAFEIFDIGMQLYAKLTGLKAYDSTKMFTPNGNQSPQNICKTNPDINKNLGAIIDKMICTKNRYEVFTELLIDLKKTY